MERKTGEKSSKNSERVYKISVSMVSELLGLLLVYASIRLNFNCFRLNFVWSIGFPLLVFQVTLKDKKITSVRYDEIFADAAKDIEAPAQKMYYGLSKYGSVQYDEPSRIGFNVQMDALNAKVVDTQDLLDLSELPAIDESGNYASSGFTVRNGAWDNYLKLANTLLTEMKADGNF